MKKASRSRIWDVGLMIAGMILPVLSTLLWGFMKTELSVPIWAILSYSLVLAFLFDFAWRSFDANAQRQHEQHAETLSAVKSELEKDFETRTRTADEQISDLENALKDQGESCERLSLELVELQRVVFDGGLYYYKRDTAKS